MRVRNPSIVWLVAGLGSVASGIALALSASVEAGVPLAVLGAGALAAGAAALLRSPSAADRERLQLDGLDRRLDELRRLEGRLLTAGVSPTEQAYHELLRPGAATEDKPTSVPSTALDDNERLLGEMIRARCDRTWEGIREQRYVKSEAGRIADLDGGAIFAEIRDIVQEVAALYHSASDNAVLEARTGDIALAVRSATGELLQMVRQIPYIDPAGWSVQEVVARLERVEKGLALYKKLSPYDHYISGVMLAARIAVGANPISLAAWTLGKEGAKRFGGKFLKSRAEAWLKELMESSVALVYLQVARIYDPQRAYRSADWVALVEALRIHARTPGIDHNRKLLLDRILRAQIPDEFAKMTLLRALADDREPDSRSAPPIDLALLRPVERKAIADRLADVLPAMKGLNAVAASDAIEDLERRLQWGLAVDLLGSGSAGEVRVAEGFAQLAALARDWLPIDRAQARRSIAASVFAGRARKSVGHAAAERALLEAVSAAYDGDESERRLVEPPRELVGDALAEPLVASLAELLATAPTGWPIEHDHMVLLNASVLLPERKQVTAVWKRYLEAASRRLRARLVVVDPATWPQRSSPAILRQIGDGERPLAVFEAKTAASRARWLLVFLDRVVVGEVPEEELAIDDGEPETHPIGTVRLVRREQRLADDLIVCCGEHRLTIAGRRTGSFERRFGAVLEPLGLGADALERER